MVHFTFRILSLILIKLKLWMVSLLKRRMILVPLTLTTGLVPLTLTTGLVPQSQLVQGQLKNLLILMTKMMMNLRTLMMHHRTLRTVMTLNLAITLNLHQMMVPPKIKQ